MDREYAQILIVQKVEKYIFRETENIEQQK